MTRSQPLLLPALLLAAGIAAQGRFEAGPAVLLTLLLAGVAGLRAFRTMGGALVLFALGAVLCWVRFAPFSELDLRAIVPEEPALASVRGRLEETPQVREFNPGESTIARLTVSEIRLRGKWQPATGTIMTRTRGALGEPFFLGREVEVAGVIRPPDEARAPGLFDYRKFLKHSLIFFQFEVSSPRDWKTRREQSPPWIERTRRWARAQLARGVPEDEALRMIWAMALGWKTALSGEMAEPFMRTGTMHIFAVSGLHVACIATMLVVALQLLGVSRHHCAALVIPLIWFYTLASGWQSSGVRSAIMSTALIGGWSLKRPAAVLNSMAAAALVILVLQPEQLFQAGFQLSFCVVMSLALLAPVLEEKWAGRLPHDPFLPRMLRPGWLQNAERIYRMARPSVIVSLACFVGSAPLTAYYFNLATPISLLANLFAVPLSSLALLFSMLSLVFSPLGPWLNFLGWAFMSGTIAVARFFERWGGYYYVPKPGGAFFLFYLCGVALLFYGWRWPRRVRWAGGILVLLLGTTWAATRPTGIEMHVLPAPGYPIWIDHPGLKRDLLIDCSNARGFEYSVKRFLHAQGVGSVPNLLLTQGDIEHVGAFTNALKDFAPRTIYTGPHSSRSPSYRDALSLLGTMTNRWRVVQRGDTLAGWTVLHPPAGEKFPRADDNSVVLSGSIEGWRVLYLSDLGADGQHSLLESDLDLRADIVIAGRPARDEPLRSGILHRIQPRVAILGDPQAETVARLKSAGAEVFNLEDDGAVRMTFRPGSCGVRSGAGRICMLSGK